MRAIGRILHLNSHKAETSYSMVNTKKKIENGKHKGKVVFVSDILWLERDYHRYGADYFDEKGYMVECITVWDYYDKITMLVPSWGECKGNNILEKNSEEFRIYLLDNTEAVYIFINDSYLKYKYEIFQYDIKYIVIGNMGLLCSRERDEKQSILSELYRYVYYFSYGHIAANMKSFIHIFFRKLKLSKTDNLTNEGQERNNISEQIKKPIAIIESTDVADIYLNDQIVDNNIVYVHSYDYDRFLENEREKITATEECIVFIEAGVLGESLSHSLCNISNEVDINKWERQCTIFFDLLEKKYNVPVVIAGHPHNKYYNRCFANRYIYLGVTEKLIPRAKLVITQTSTAISQILLYNKKFIFLENSDIRRFLRSYDYDMFSMYTYFIKILGCKVLNLDKIRIKKINIDNYITVVGEVARDRYINMYVKMRGTLDKMTYEIMEDIVNDMQIVE